MRVRKNLPATTTTMLLFVLALTTMTAQAQRRRQETVVRTPSNPPTVTLEAETNTVTLCALDAGAPTRLRLKANARSPEGRVITYRWTTTGGRIDGDGPEVMWDLTGVTPGKVYVATVEANTGVEGDACLAFTSIPVAVNECAPPRPVCPNISIYCPDTVMAGASATFTAEVSGGTAGVTPTFNWKVSAGSITSGQGTPSITVDTAGLGGKAITASVEVMGYNLNCAATCAAQVPAPPEGNRFDVYNDVRFNDEKARLDNFAVQLQNEPAARGYLVVYGARGGAPDAARRRANRARDYIVNERAIGSDRVVVSEGGVRDILTLELWLVPTGAEPPRPTP